MDKVWQFLAGLGLFVFGMRLLETALKELAGRTFKLFLKKHTRNKITAIGGGTLVTALLQSSSVVSLMVLAFVGAGIMSMKNAISVVLGANLGSTVSNWLVVLLGFEMDIESFSFPVIALSGITLLLFSEQKNLRRVAHFALGFGLLFLGIAFMKTTIEEFLRTIDLSKYHHYHRVYFVLFGAVATFLLQTSSVMMVIVLGALSQNAIPFHAAVAIIIGSEFGTSMKLIIGAAGGSAAKKQVAMSNVIFNFVTVVFSTILMYSFIWLVRQIVSEDKPLIALVTFQTLINFTGILLFYPFLNPLSKFLQRRFVTGNDNATFFIPAKSNGSFSLELLEKEVQYFIFHVMVINLDSFEMPENAIDIDEEITRKIRMKQQQRKSFADRYKQLKLAEGEILSWVNRSNKSDLNEKDERRLEKLLAAMRSATYSAKGLKDIHEDFKDFKRSTQDAKYTYHRELQAYLQDFYNELLRIMKDEDPAGSRHELKNMMKKIKDDYVQHMESGRAAASGRQLEDKDISTLLNVNRELYSSCKSMIFSLKDYLLEPAAAEEFGDAV